MIRSKKTVYDDSGFAYPYDQLIWAADMTQLYNMIAFDGISENIKNKIQAQKMLVDKGKGNNSVLTVYADVDMPKEFFMKRGEGHIFFTPQACGLHVLEGERKKLLLCEDLNKFESMAFRYLNDFLELTTYEISIPVLRDDTLAPAHRTGLVISTVFDFALTLKFQTMGLYDFMKQFVAQRVIKVLDQSLYPGLKKSLKNVFSSTPCTYANMFGNRSGAITGWAFAQEVPAVDRFTQIRKAVLTPIPNITQAGQWTFSPSGFPTSIITAKLAANHVLKNL